MLACRLQCWIFPTIVGLQVYKARWRGAPAAVKMWSHEISPADGTAEVTRKRTEATLRFRTEAALQVRGGQGAKMVEEEDYRPRCR